MEAVDGSTGAPSNLWERDMEQFTVQWHDSGREPQCAPNPAYPHGKAIAAADPSRSNCIVELPYPAKRCGAYSVVCGICGIKVAVTTAGRVDDPISVAINCLEK